MACIRNGQIKPLYEQRSGRVLSSPHRSPPRSGLVASPPGRGQVGRDHWPPTGQWRQVAQSADRHHWCCDTVSYSTPSDRTGATERANLGRTCFLNFAQNSEMLRYFYLFRSRADWIHGCSYSQAVSRGAGSPVTSRPNPSRPEKKPLKKTSIPNFRAKFRIEAE